jgi:predicted secreted protein
MFDAKSRAAVTPRAWIEAAVVLGTLAALWPGAAFAQPVLQPPPQNVMTLAATATLDVPKDWLGVVLSTAREGPDANQVQSQLKAALDTALAEVRKGARPGLLEVRTGAFSLYPRYAARTGGSGPQISGWQGSAELVVEGRDVAAISQLVGRIQTLTIARVGFSLSREAREKVEADVAAQAIARFRAQAESYAKQFGFGSYALREVQVSLQGDEGPRPMPVMRAQAASVAGDAALPVEAGKAAVTASVSGSVQLTLR